MDLECNVPSFIVLSWKNWKLIGATPIKQTDLYHNAFTRSRRIRETHIAKKHDFTKILIERAYRPTHRYETLKGKTSVSSLLGINDLSTPPELGSESGTNDFKSKCLNRYANGNGLSDLFRSTTWQSAYLLLIYAVTGRWLAIIDSDSQQTFVQIA